MSTKLLSLKEAMKFFKEHGYDEDELKQYSELELKVLATDMKNRMEEIV